MAPKPIQRAKRRNPPARKSKAYRVDARLNEEQKLLIQCAAELEAGSMTDSVLHSAESPAA